MVRLVEVAFVLTGLVLVGMRSIAQQQVGALSQIECDRSPQDSQDHEK